MHVSEGVLSPPILIIGIVLSLGGISLGLKNIKEPNLPKVAILSSASFVASFIHIPIGPSSAHLVLNGLIGLILGWAAFPSIFLGLFLQALLFQFGGFTTLGVNTFSMSFPGVLSYYLFSKMLLKGNIRAWLGGFLAGTFSIISGALLISLALIETEKSFIGLAGTLLVTHLPIAIVEGIITGFIVVYLKKVKPELVERRIIN